MKVFIENESNSNLKNIFNEKIFELKETIKVARPYPYPYGFIIDTTAPDGDNVDAFIITDKELKSGQIVECDPIGLMEQFEKPWDNSKSDIEEVDHNVLLVLKEDKDMNMKAVNKQILSEFVKHVFDNIQLNKTRVGRFLSKENAMLYIEDHKDPFE